MDISTKLETGDSPLVENFLIYNSSPE